MHRFKLYISERRTKSKHALYKIVLDGNEHVVNAVIQGLENNNYSVNNCAIFDNNSNQYVEIELLRPAM